MPRPKSFFVQQGQRFGRGVVLDPEIVLTADRNGQPLKKSLRGACLQCDCGAVYETALGSLKRESVRSCGCLRLETSTTRILSVAVQEKSRQAATRHGFSTAHRAEYNRWRGMVARCEDPTRAGWENYGGRGIKVCERWHDPWLYWEDIQTLGPRPPGATLDRKDNDGDYELSNVQWSPWSRQTRNQRRARGAVFIPRLGKWVSKVQLGTFSSREEAEAVYRRAVAVLTQAGIIS